MANTIGAQIEITADQDSAKDIRVEHADASRESDRRMILNSMLGNRSSCTFEGSFVGVFEARFFSMVSSDKLFIFCSGLVRDHEGSRTLLPRSLQALPRSCTLPRIAQMDDLAAEPALEHEGISKMCTFTQWHHLPTDANSLKQLVASAHAHDMMVAG